MDWTYVCTIRIITFMLMDFLSWRINYLNFLLFFNENMIITKNVAWKSCRRLRSPASNLQERLCCRMWKFLQKLKNQQSYPRLPLDHDFLQTVASRRVSWSSTTVCLSEMLADRWPSEIRTAIRKITEAFF